MKLLGKVIAKPLGKISATAFSTMKFCDDWFGLPNKISESLHFRLEWKDYFTAVPLKKPSLWIHGASVGELEDLASFFSDEALLKSAGFEKASVVITASSISAREKLKSLGKDLGVAYAGPLPPENQTQIDEFLERIDPDIFIISQSDMWPLLIERAYKKLRRGIFWLPSRDSSAKILAPLCLDPARSCIGTRSIDSQPLATLFKSTFIGNLRQDRILDRIERAANHPEHALEKWGAAPDPQKISFLLGSCWMEDAAFWSKTLSLLSEYERSRLQLVAIPHETRDSFQSAGIQGLLPKARVLSIEGVLVEAYRNFSAAFVGGGFKSGLHNVLEPALWGLPVFCGPHTRKQPDTAMLQSLGVLSPLKEPSQMVVAIRQLLNPAQAKMVKANGAQTAALIAQQRGASQRLAENLKNFRPDGQ